MPLSRAAQISRSQPNLRFAAAAAGSEDDNHTVASPVTPPMTMMGGERAYGQSVTTLTHLPPAALAPDPAVNQIFGYERAFGQSVVTLAPPHPHAPAVTFAPVATDVVVLSRSPTMHDGDSDSDSARARRRSRVAAERASRRMSENEIAQLEFYPSAEESKKDPFLVEFGPDDPMNPKVRHECAQ